MNTVEFLDIERKKTSVDFSRVMIDVSLTEAKAKSKLYWFYYYQLGMPMHSYNFTCVAKDESIFKDFTKQVC